MDHVLCVYVCRCVSSSGHPRAGLGCFFQGTYYILGESLSKKFVVSMDFPGILEQLRLKQHWEVPSAQNRVSYKVISVLEDFQGLSLHNSAKFFEYQLSSWEHIPCIQLELILRQSDFLLLLLCTIVKGLNPHKWILTFCTSM